MNLDRSAIVRATIAASLTAGLAWWMSNELLEPGRRQADELRRNVRGLQEKIARSRAAVQSVRDLEVAAATARMQMEELERRLPRGPVTIWLPELLKKHFARFGVEGTTVRMNTMRAVPDLSGYSRGYWSLGVPIREGNHSDLGTFLAAAELEKQHPYVKVVDFAIRPEPEDPKRRIALLNVSVLVRD